MEIVKRESEWWIVGPPLELDCGPYDRRTDAEVDMRGMTRFYKYESRPGFVSSDAMRRRKAR